MPKSYGASLAIISITHAINHLYQFILPVAIPKIATEYHLSNFSIGLLIACFSLSYSLFQAPFGRLSHRYGRKQLISLGLIVNALSLLVIGVIFQYAFNLWSFAFLLFLAGIGGSTYHPLGISLIADAYVDKRGQAMGLHQTGGAIGSFISPLLIGAIITAANWQSAFLALSPLGLLLAPFIWSHLKDVKRASTLQENVEKRAYRPALILILASAIYVVGFRGLSAFATQYFHEDRGLSYGEATVLFSMLQIAGIFSGPICGRLSDSFGRRKTIFILIILNAFSLFAITRTSNAFLYLMCNLFGFTVFGLLATTDAYLSEITPDVFLRTMIGVNLTTSFVVGTVIPPFLGKMIDIYGFGLSLTALSAVTLISLIPLMAINKGSQAHQYSS